MTARVPLSAETIPQKSVSLPYCLNVHPGETLAEVEESVRTHTAAVKARLSPDAPYPVGLRLSAAAVEELFQEGDGSRLTSFRQMFEEQGMFVPCINGFPYGAFHGTPVKSSVYRPDWSTRERFTYTTRLLSILSALLPPGGRGSVSTVPLAYRMAENRDSGVKRSAYVHAMALMAVFLETLRKEEGVRLTLALEPEPDCLLEDTQDVISWFEDELLTEGKAWMLRHHGRTPEEAEEILRRGIGVCLDTCHFSVVFEDPYDALRRLESAGIHVARVQLSAALRATVSEASRTALAPFIDPVHLHQTKVRAAGARRLQSFPDLTPKTLQDLPNGAEVRSHFHVPLFFEGNGPLDSTHGDLSPAFFAAVRERKIPLEIETYTFDALPPPLRTETVEDCIVRETEWALKRL